MSDNKEEEKLALGEWSERKRPPKRTFPGPRLAGVVLRVAFERTAYADVTVHAKQSVDAEVCGVLVGEICRDDEGEFVHVKNIIQGQSARQASNHVTYTQETWNAIHKTMDERYPKLQIVGWYHTHPGYGVEFSDMDLFIQKNFFSGQGQIGFVTDPLGGDVAICTNADDGVAWVDRFWVDAREYRCSSVPRTAGSSQAGRQIDAASAHQMESVEARLSQVIRAMDDLRATVHRFVFWTTMTAATLMALGVGFYVYDQSSNPMRLPEVRSWAPVPVKIEGKTCVLGVAVVGWEIPPELVATPPPDPQTLGDGEPKSSDQPNQNPDGGQEGSRK